MKREQLRNSGLLLLAAVIWGVAGTSGFLREEDDKTDKYHRLRVSHV